MTIDATPTRPRPIAATGILKPAASAALIGLIVHLASERVYWDHDPAWFTTAVGSSAFMVAFYTVAVAGALWLLGRIPFRGLHQIVLAGAVFGWTVEGVVVYVIHEAGPLDLFFPAMFVGWHGLVAFVGFFYLVRRFALARDHRAMGMLAAGLGLVFGLWASTALLPDGGATVADGFASGAPSVAVFGWYAGLLTVVLAAAHVALGRVWPSTWRSGRRSGMVVVGLTVAYACRGFLVIPWGPVRLAVLMALPVVALFATARGQDGPNLFQALAGRVRPGSLAGLVAMPLVATVAYAAISMAGASEALAETLQWSLAILQILLGGAALAWASVRAFRTPGRQPVTEAGTAP